MLLKKNNHLLPRLIIKNWQDKGGKIYSKNNNDYSEISYLDFSSKYYYSLGLKDDNLENRISKFEARIGNVIKKIKESSKAVLLTGKELELLKLFCVLSACRQHNTSPVILNDESGIYSNNNYILGVPLVKTQRKAVDATSKIIDEFERINTLPNDSMFENWSPAMNSNTTNSLLALGQHLSIIKSSSNNIMISDICAIIECTMDSDYLYTYVPISPCIALLLVKSEYYQTREDFESTKERFGRKYGNGNKDPFISTIFQNDESALLNNSYRRKLLVTNVPSEIDVPRYNSAFLSIHECDKTIFEMFNSIVYEDGKKIVYCSENDLELSRRKLQDRYISWDVG